MPLVCDKSTAFLYREYTAENKKDQIIGLFIVKLV